MRLSCTGKRWISVRVYMVGSPKSSHIIDIELIAYRACFTLSITCVD